MDGPGFRYKIKTTKKLPNGDVIDISYVLDDYISGKKRLMGEIFPKDLIFRNDKDYSIVRVEKGRCFIACKVYKDLHNGNYYMNIKNPKICEYTYCFAYGFGTLHFKNRLKYNKDTKKYELIAIDLENVERMI